MLPIHNGGIAIEPVNVTNYWALLDEPCVRLWSTFVRERGFDAAAVPYASRSALRGLDYQELSIYEWPLAFHEPLKDSSLTLKSKRRFRNSTVVRS